MKEERMRENGKGKVATPSLTDALGVLRAHQEALELAERASAVRDAAEAEAEGYRAAIDEAKAELAGLQAELESGRRHVAEALAAENQKLVTLQARVHELGVMEASLLNAMREYVPTGIQAAAERDRARRRMAKAEAS
jgi:hypothetical protein